VAGGAGAGGESGRVRVLVVTATVVFAATSVLAATARSTPRTTYASASSAATIADLAAGLTALGVGCLAVVVRGRTSLAVLMVLIGAAWFAPDWVGWASAPPVVRSIAMVAVPFIVALIAHLAIAYPSGRVTVPWMRALLAVAYATTAIASIGRALFRDPFRDLYCWSNCTDNVFLVEPDRVLTRVADGLGWRSAVSLGLVAAGAAVWRLLSATPVARRATWFVLVPAATALLAIAATALVLANDRAGEPTDDHHAALFTARALAVAALGLGFGWGLLRANRAGRAVARLAEALGSTPAPGTLGQTLARSFGDDGLTVAYRLSESDRYVDAAGRPIDPHPRRDQATTTIVRHGQPLAVVVHDLALGTEHDLAREIGAAARLAVDNERLRAENLVQVEDLRASRARLVATADTARRRLERDLHDGAQQRLLAVLYELRLASSAAARAADVALQPRIDESSRLAEQTLSELRDLAHGIYPAILTEAGLAPALRTLADRAPIPVELADVVDDRSDADVEATAYLVVADTIDHASKASATAAIVRVERSARDLVVDVKHDGNPLCGDAVVNLADRVGALGGRLTVDDAGVRAELPCVS
jgi:signal transduction histidine kinase